MSMRGAVAGCVVLVCLLALVVERTEGHITFFSPKELLQMKRESVHAERKASPQNDAATTMSQSGQQNGKKDTETRSEDGQVEEVTVRQAPLMEHDGNPDDTLAVAVRLLPRQVDYVAPGLEEIIHEIVEQSQKDK